MNLNNRLPASFRDPSGFIFLQGQSLYRQINKIYQPHYDHLISSGLYDQLVQKKMLVTHREAAVTPPAAELAYRVVEPELIPFISYPYEWCFSQLKDAALLTLAIQKTALKYGMTLMDASAYNIQFLRGRPVLIDTLSFEIYPEGEPWTGYQQFCKHFLAPLALMVHRDVRLNQLLRIYIDGIPLDLASSLLPVHTRLDFGLLTHLHLQASAQKRYAGGNFPASLRSTKVSRSAQLGLLESLESTVRKLNWKPGGSEWVDYYDATNYSRAAFDAKASLVAGFLKIIRPELLLDLGANTGVFSRIASESGIFTVSADIDPGAVELNYLDSKTKGEENLLPLILDLTNPSPGTGWDNREREAFFERRPAGAVLALALIHHLAIANNLPLGHVAAFFARLGRWSIVEFVPKEDSQVQRLLRNRRDIFGDYHQAGFEAAFSQHFSIRQKVCIPDSLRILYLLEKNDAGIEARDSL
jgi:hypothetical protein